MITRRTLVKSSVVGLASISLPSSLPAIAAPSFDQLDSEFFRPPNSARPWVFWLFMDGNLTREGMTADLEALKAAGVGGAIYMEVGIGVPRGPVEFMSVPWQELLGHAFSEADRLGLQIALAAGPGWCGTGGPWVKPELSMQHLVSSETVITGPANFDAALPKPLPREPFFGEDTLSPELHKIWKEFYLDVLVLAFPTPVSGQSITDIDEKALYTRGSYSSQIPGPYTRPPSVRPFFQMPPEYEVAPSEACVASTEVLDLTDKLGPDGHLTWAVPPGKWTIMRFGRTITGQTTRPAPAPGLGLETDKFDQTAIDEHFAAYIGSLLKKAGEPKRPGRGLTTLHFDSWEMSSQNWSEKFGAEFLVRRGYDLRKFLPTFSGHVVDGFDVSERFLWDVRQTAQELVVANQITRLRMLGQRHGLQLSLEPYDLNPCADLTLGSVADVPMGEFWSKGWDAKTDFSIVEAVSLGHTLGRSIIGAEAFTALQGEDGQQYPGSMKVQGDWALCAGINRFVFHRYQAQPWMNRCPGMMMGTDGGYGVDWQRTQTWWGMVHAYHLYLARCQHVLRRGLFVADILYLGLEGAPSVFLPPRSALRDGEMRDRRGYNFDGVAPETFIERASVKDGKIVFPDGMSYRILVLPRSVSMTPRLLEKIHALVEGGATVFGAPPRQSPSLEDYPRCDLRVKELAVKLWGHDPGSQTVGQGKVVLDRDGVSPKINPLALAQWIWFPEGNAATRPSVGMRFFQRTFHVASVETLDSAYIAMTADDSFEIRVNGRLVGRSSNRTLWTESVIAHLKDGENTLRVMAMNGVGRLPRGGLTGSLTLHDLSGTKTVFYTDRAWNSSQTEHGPMVPAAELGAAGTSPWNLDESAFAPYSTYPSYENTVKILSAAGLPPDFEGGDQIRYIHRRDGEQDYYFIANAVNFPVAVNCRFRLIGMEPEWWDPLSGTRRLLPEFTKEAGVTTIPIRLDVGESGFVVFRRHPADNRKRGKNFPSFSQRLTLTGPWEVSFDPRWGGPQSVQFERLEDWTSRPEPGIKYYSGSATYRMSFDCPQDDGQGANYLCLGDVKNIASVTLNNQDLGVLWCHPWRVEIATGLLRPRNNTLQVTVANLWINRLIADSGLPQDQRLTWTTSNPHHPDDPLKQSGLLGPVSILEDANRTLN
jgi:hypothetical protein